MGNLQFPNSYDIINDTSAHEPAQKDKGPWQGFVMHNDTVFDEIKAVGKIYNTAECLILVKDIQAGAFFPLRILEVTLSAGTVLMANSQ